MIENKADISAKDVQGNTPLHCAVISSEYIFFSFIALIQITTMYLDATDVVDFLIEHGAGVDTTNSETSTALHIAVLKGLIYFRNNLGK